jgi:hypothetical protein
MLGAPALSRSTEIMPGTEMVATRPVLAALSPEAQVVLLSAGGAERDGEIRALLRGGVDWPKVVRLAEREGAVSILWRRLRVLEDARIPSETAAQLQRLAMVAEFRLLRLEQRLGDALDLLAEAGVDVVLLKGAALACAVYGSFPLRPMGDADLLVRRERADEAMALLMAHGWTAEGGEAHEEFYAGHHHRPPLDDRAGSGARLELHTGLFFDGHPFRFDAPDVRSRAVALAHGRRMVWVPEVEDQVLHVCLHFVWSHMLALGAWRTFRDLRMLLSAQGFDWTAFTRMAIESRGGSCCYWALRLARDLVGVEVPAPVLQALCPPEPDYVLHRVQRHFTYHMLPSECICPSLRVARAMWTTGVRPVWSGHGDVRPWDRTASFRVAGREATTGIRKVAHHIGSAGEWGRYLRAMLPTDPRH